MRIGIIGTGRMGRNLAAGWQKSGHEVVFGSRNPDSKDDLQAVAIDDALKADVIVIAVPFTAVEGFARQYAGQLRDKIVVDITNPFDNLPDNRIAGAEITAKAIGEGARVIAAFKPNFWQTLLEPVDPQQAVVRDVFIAGDDDDDKAVVSRLVTDLGFRPIDCGVLRNARILDGMVPLIIELDRRYGQGEGRVSWKLLG